MDIIINIDNSKVDNFSSEALVTLKKQIEKHMDDIVNEAHLIEDAIREDGASIEITSNMVLQAVRKNKTIRKKKSDKRLLIFKIISSFSLLITGFLFDSEGYQNNVLKLILFIVFLVVACVSTVLQFVLEEKE